MTNLVVDGRVRESDFDGRRKGKRRGIHRNRNQLVNEQNPSALVDRNLERESLSSIIVKLVSPLQLTSIIFKMGQSRPLFNLFLVFANKHYNFTTNICEKISIQYTVPGFEPPTFGT